MYKKNLIRFCILCILLLAHHTFKYAKGEEYLDSVINKINKMEKDLERLQSESAYENKLSTDNTNNNTIASHEKRLIDLEDELRKLNGRIDEVLFELKNVTNEIADLKAGAVNLSSDISDSENITIVEESKKTEVITLEDPNMKENPSMQVLGLIKDNKKTEEAYTNDLNDKATDISNIDKESTTDQKLANLSKDPSAIYKLAYNMLIQENFSEAEKYFNIFLGENPNDPLASNAYYWLGETFYVQKQFRKAEISFAKGYRKFPKGNKALDQLFKLALTFINLGKNEDACAAFSRLEIEFPNASNRIKNRAKELKTRAKCST